MIPIIDQMYGQTRHCAIIGRQRHQWPRASTLGGPLMLAFIHVHPAFSPKTPIANTVFKGFPKFPQD